MSSNNNNNNNNNSSSKIELLIWFSQFMGGLCSRSSQDVDRVFANSSDADSDHNKPNPTTPPQPPQTMDRNNPPGPGEVFYDGIPLYADKPRAKQPTTVAKVLSQSLIQILLYLFHFNCC
jgi:hypothetical protein